MMTLATTPAMFGQARSTPFSNYIIQLDETGATGAIASSCVQLPEAPTSVVLHDVELLALLYVAFDLWNELFTMSIQLLSHKVTNTVVNIHECTGLTLDRSAMHIKNGN